MDSVLSQDFQDFEYVLIDGGSSDGTVATIKRYASRLAYWHSRPDRGIAHAFNLGIENSWGEWLMFLNADDFLADGHALSSLARVIERDPRADVVYGQVEFVTSGAVTVRTGTRYGAPFSWSRYVTWRRTIPHPAAVTSRRYIERAGGFREEYRVGMDYEMYLRSGRELRAVFEPLLVARMRLGGVSRRAWRQALREWRRAVICNHALPRVGVGLAYAYLYARLLTGSLHRRAIGRAGEPEISRSGAAR
jgi:glycosyltransferase